MKNQAQKNTKIAIAADHAGFELKARLIRELPQFDWIDLGTTDASRVDYPDYADRVAKAVVVQNCFGVLVCGSGQGMAMRANRHSGIRAALAWNVESAQLSREHNDANILCLGARLIDPGLAKSLVEVFTTTAFQGGRHSDRVQKIERCT